MPHEILIVDDEADIRNIIADLLKDEGYATRTAADGPSALEKIRNRRPSLVILDIWLGDSRFDGVKALELIKSTYPTVPVVMMSGHGNVETAVASIKKGAYDFIEKPFKANRLFLVVKRAIEAAQLLQENQTLRPKIKNEWALIGSSQYASQLHQLVNKIAPSNTRLFISGPPGSGKETIARMIHSLSPRTANGSFLVLNCSALSQELFERELFGAEATATQQPHTGILEQSHLGTLLLDEVTDMPVATQSKLARMLQENTFRRIGGEHDVEIDVRILASSSRNTDFAIQEGRLREDFFYRLNVVPITAKPLKERKEDIPEIANHFFKLTCTANGYPERSIAQDAITALQTYDWPGNLRQLRNVIDWILIMAINEPKGLITAEMLPAEIVSNLPSAPQWEGVGDILKLPLRDAREIFEKQYLLSQVSRFSGNISKTANFIGMERSALHRKLRSLGLDREGNSKAS